MCPGPTTRAGDRDRCSVDCLFLLAVHSASDCLTVWVYPLPQLAKKEVVKLEKKKALVRRCWWGQSAVSLVVLRLR